MSTILLWPFPFVSVPICEHRYRVHAVIWHLMTRLNSSLFICLFYITFYHEMRLGQRNPVLWQFRKSSRINDNLLILNNHHKYQRSQRRSAIQSGPSSEPSTNQRGDLDSFTYVAYGMTDDITTNVNYSGIAHLWSTQSDRNPFGRHRNQWGHHR